MKVDAARGFDHMKHECIVACLVSSSAAPAQYIYAVMLELSFTSLDIFFQCQTFEGLEYSRGGRRGAVRPLGSGIGSSVTL